MPGNDVFYHIPQAYPPAISAMPHSTAARG